MKDSLLKTYDENFENNPNPLIKRILGNPGYDIKYGYSEENISENGIKPISFSHWRVAHWRVAHWRVAHWRVASWKNSTIVNTTTVDSKCLPIMENVNEVNLSNGVSIREEKFGLLVYKEGDVFAINKTGKVLLEFILTRKNIDEPENEINKETFYGFISDLFRLGIIEFI